MNVIEKVIETAKAEIGYLEKASNAQLDSKTANAGRSNWTKYARDLDETNLYNGKKNGYPWCDIFFDWCLVQCFGLAKMQEITYQPSRGVGAGCTYSAQYYRNVGRFVSTPQPGDQIFFTQDGGKTSNHTGLVVDVAGDRVYTIEGNTSAASGVVPNGGCVAEKSYRLSFSQIGGYGRPNYEAASQEIPTNLSQFKALWRALQKELQDNDSDSYSDEAKAWAIEEGLFLGNGETDDGQPNMMWQDFLTREQLVTVLYRFKNNLVTIYPSEKRESGPM